MQMQGSSSLGHADMGSVALPAILRAGETGSAQFSVGNVQPAKFSTTSHQAHTGHMPSTVSHSFQSFLITIVEIFDDVTEELVCSGKWYK